MGPGEDGGTTIKIMTATLELLWMTVPSGAVCGHRGCGSRGAVNAISKLDWSKDNSGNGKPRQIDRGGGGHGWVRTLLPSFFRSRQQIQVS